MKREKIFLLILVSFNFFQIKATNPPILETLNNRVSFLFVQENDSLHQSELKKIEKLFEENKYSDALKLSFDYIKLDNNKSNRFKAFYLIGEIYKKNNNHTKAINYYKKSLRVLKQKDSLFNENSKSFSGIQLTKIYLLLGNEYLRIKNKDSSKFFYNKALNINILDDKSLSYQASASTNISGLYRQDSLFDLAKQYAIKAVDIQKKRKNIISEAAALGNLASIYLDENNYDKAKETYQKALTKIKFEKSDRAFFVREKLYFNLAYNLYKLKDYEAYTYQELSYNIKDSLRDKEIRTAIEELSSKYDFNSKKALILKEEENKRLKSQRGFLALGIIALLIIGSLIYVIKMHRLRQRNLQLKLQKTELLKNKQLSKLKSESQVRILNATIDGKESERKLIAETLHDSVSSLLSSANLHLQATSKHYKGNTPVEIDKTQEIIAEAARKIRDLSHNLVSSVLLKFGLTFAINELAEKFSNSELKIHTEFAEVNRYHKNFEIKVHNIIQELVNNILKHSKAQNAFIKLKEANSKLFIEITDDGLGFDKTKITLKEGIGIQQIDARIQMMKGDFSIDSSPEKGTKIKIELPIQKKETLYSAS